MSIKSEHIVALYFYKLLKIVKRAQKRLVDLIQIGSVGF
jgi:hypothetical protein